MSVRLNCISDHSIRRTDIANLLIKLESLRPLLIEWDTVCEGLVSSAEAQDWFWAWQEEFSDPTIHWESGHTLTVSTKGGLFITISQHVAIMHFPIIWTAFAGEGKIRTETIKLVERVVRLIGGQQIIALPSSSAICAEQAANGVEEQLELKEILLRYHTCMRSCPDEEAKYLLWKLPK